jgi:hypothetical protein
MTMHNRSRSRSGQMIYQLMLILACAALAIAAFFPTLDYFQTYRGAVVGGSGNAPRRGDAVTPSGAAATTATTLAPEETTATTLPAAETTDTDATKEGG